MAELEESVKAVVTELADKVVEEVTNTDTKPIETSSKVPDEVVSAAVPEVVSEVVLAVVPEVVPEVVPAAVPEVVLAAVPEIVLAVVPEIVLAVVPAAVPEEVPVAVLAVVPAKVPEVEELKVVEPVIYKVTSTPGEGVIAQGLHLVGLKMITESSLSEDQKKLATSIYESVKAAIKEFISDPSINETIKITKTLAKLVKELENAKVDGKAPTGADKKAVAIQLGRILIKEVITSDSLEANILMVYDIVAEPTLEAMIEVSKVVNVVVQKVATSCGPTFDKVLKCLRLKGSGQ